MAYKIRIILDVEEDVLRDLLIDESVSLETLHFAIAKSFGFKGQEMASFYKTDDNWDQGEEIPLFNMSDDTTAPTMHNCKLKDVLKFEGDKLIYVYDFFAMWTFFVELSEIKPTIENDDLPKTTLIVGEVPDKAPEKEFIAEDDLENFENFNEGNEFEDLDDIDINNY